MKKINFKFALVNKLTRKFERKTRALARVQSHRIVQLAKSGNRRLEAIFEADVPTLAKATFKFTRYQLKIRPRIKLFSLVILILATIFLATNYALDYLKPREAEIKVLGQPILVADQAQKQSQNLGEVEIQQAVGAKLSPFEFARPVDSGYVSQGYRRYHPALDIACDFGTPIHPVGAGRVEFAGYSADGKGNIVIVDHGDNLKSLYAHMGKVAVGVGNEVDAKTTIGTVGLTGRTTGAHVHFEIYDHGNAVNPENILP